MVYYTGNTNTDTQRKSMTNSTQHQYKDKILHFIPVLGNEKILFTVMSKAPKNTITHYNLTTHTHTHTRRGRYTIHATDTHHHDLIPAAYINNSTLPPHSTHHINTGPEQNSWPNIAQRTKTTHSQQNATPG